MTDVFTLADASVLLKLTAAHILTDFYLQKNKWVKDKLEKNLASPYSYIHALMAGALAWLFLWNLAYWWVFAITFATHLLIDAWKIKLTNQVSANTTTTQKTKAKKELHLFVADQVLHVVVIILLWILVTNGWRKFSFATENMVQDYRFLLLVTGYLIVIQPTGYFIGFVTKRWLPELNMHDSLQDAGTWIGILERIIVLTLIYAGQYSSIGFLIAAKSILRVTDKPEKSSDSEATPFSSRKHTEYVLIGTFLSFGCALLTGIFITTLLRLH